MLKKSLIAIAILAIVMPAFAVDNTLHVSPGIENTATNAGARLKVHDPWPTQYVPQTIGTIDVQLDVGFYISVENRSPIVVSQDTTANMPMETYTGCASKKIISNFPAKVMGSVAATSDAGGSWSVKFDGNPGSIVVAAGTTTVEICIDGKNVNISKLVGGSKNVKVAELTLTVLPEGSL